MSLILSWTLRLIEGTNLPEDEPKSYLTVVPRTEAAKRDMLAMDPLPVGWEYLLFISELRAGLDRREADWRDYALTYAPPAGPSVSLADVLNHVGAQMDRSKFIVRSIMLLVEPGSQERAFGRPDESGDRTLIEHLALRLTDCYGQMIEWGLARLSTVVPDDAYDLMVALSKMVETPIREFRDWVDTMERDFVSGLKQLESGEAESVHLTSELILTIPEGNLTEVNRQLRLVARAIRKSR